MARKSRKHVAAEIKHYPLYVPETVGYVRLSVKDDMDNRIENQKRVILAWGDENETPVAHFYVDDGYSGRHFDRPAFQEMLRHIEDGHIGCIVVKDLSRLGREHIMVGYYLERYFPSKKIRFVSVSDQFETTDGMRDVNLPDGTQIRIPITNLINEQIPLDTKKKVEVVLDMKAQQGMFIGPKAPFGYKKADFDHNRLVPDQEAAAIVKRIFALAAEGMGVTGIVRHLNQHNIPTPIQYARSKGLEGNYDDGNGVWNSRSVKYILTNRVYTGMLVQGKERRVVSGTHEPLVSTVTFNAIQKSFQTQRFHIAPDAQPSENILKGKVIYACCGSKMQRKRGTGHADWHFFTCITKNRIGADHCTGMYAREEDIIAAIYHTLDTQVKELFIAAQQYKAKIQAMEEELVQATATFDDACEKSMRLFEKFATNECTRDEFQEARKVSHDAREAETHLTAEKEAYTARYEQFRKMLAVSRRELPLSSIVADIERVTVADGKRITVKWA